LREVRLDAEGGQVLADLTARAVQDRKQDLEFRSVSAVVTERRQSHDLTGVELGEA
jgi:hypothetical protein